MGGARLPWIGWVPVPRCRWPLLHGCTSLHRSRTPALPLWRPAAPRPLLPSSPLLLPSSAIMTNTAPLSSLPRTLPPPPPSSPGICDSVVARCFCDGKYRHIPAVKFGGPPLQRGRPLGNHLCQVAAVAVAVVASVAVAVAVAAAAWTSFVQPLVPGAAVAAAAWPNFGKWATQ